MPDFSGMASLLFEARTLFFLASWHRVHGDRRMDPKAPRLHVCCIGDPPASVARLAATVGVSVESHPPIREAGLINKLRGLEVRHRDGRLLLLDVDMLVLQELSPLMELQADLAAAVAGKAQVPEAAWRDIHAALGIEMPTERLVSVSTRAGLDTRGIACWRANLEEESRSMIPYYNTGAILLDARCPLRDAWHEMHARLQSFLPTSPAWRDLPVLDSNDQPSFALATADLRRRGFRFAALPETYNARLPHFSGGLLNLDDVRLFHFTGLAAGLLQPGSTRAVLPGLVESHAGRWAAAFDGPTTSPLDRRKTTADGRRAARWLQELWRTGVHDAWFAG